MRGTVLFQRNLVRAGGVRGKVLRIACGAANLLVGHLALTHVHGNPRVHVLLGEVSLGGATLRRQAHRTVGQAAGHNQERGVRHHAVVGAHSQALDVPAAHNGLVALGFGEAAVQAHALHQARHLGHGRNVADEHAAGCEHLRNSVQAFPGGEHVEDHAVDAAGLLDLRQGVLQVADAQLPRRVRAAEHGLNVAAGDVCELFTAFEGVHASVVADRTQQGDGQCTGADAGLDDARAGEDICLDDNLGGVLGVDDGRAARHGEHEVFVEGAQRLIEDAVGVGDDGAFGCADEVVVLEEALVGVVFAAFGEGDGGDAAAFVGNLDALAGAEGAAAVNCAGGGVGAAAHGVVLLGWVCLCCSPSRRTVDGKSPVLF